MKIRIGKNDLPSLHDNGGHGGRNCNSTSAFALPIHRRGWHGSPADLTELFCLPVVTQGFPGLANIMPTPSPPGLPIVMHTPSLAVLPIIFPRPSGIPIKLTVLPQPHVLFCESVNTNESNDSDDKEDFEVQQAVIAELSLTPDMDQKLENGNEFCTMLWNTRVCSLFTLTN